MEELQQNLKHFSILINPADRHPQWATANLKKVTVQCSDWLSVWNKWKITRAWFPDSLKLFLFRNCLSMYLNIKAVIKQIDWQQAVPLTWKRHKMMQFDYENGMNYWQKILLFNTHLASAHGCLWINQFGLLGFCKMTMKKLMKPWTVWAGKAESWELSWCQLYRHW